MEQVIDIINERELISLRALISYAAHKRKMSEDIVNQTVKKNFDVSDVTQLPRQSYDNVIRFLVDTQIDSFVN